MQDNELEKELEKTREQVKALFRLAKTRDQCFQLRGHVEQMAISQGLKRRLRIMGDNCKSLPLEE